MFNLYKNQKVLITGHTGFKGSWLAAWLQKLRAQITGIALLPNTDPAHFNLLKLDIESHIIDIRDSAKLSQKVVQINPTIIFHLAAQPLVRNSYLEPLLTLETNIIGTANLLNACRNLPDLKAIVVITSDKCYENREWIWGYRESDPMGGYDPYSASKGCTELVTASFRNSFFNLNDYGYKHQTLIASARAGNVIGGGDWSKDRLIPDIIRAIINKEKVIIRNPNATRPWQHVLECLSGYLSIGEKLLNGEKQFAEAWNFAANAEESLTVLNMVQKIEKLWPQLQYDVRTNNEQPHEANLLKLDASKATALLKWKNVWSIEQTLEKTINWYRTFYEIQDLLTFNDIENYINDCQKYIK